ncbi:MAG TPA: phosphate ABC transporter permease subunit PstC, partial [Candidatus Methanoperedenaceae archaeon]|nr:phosphate ABC transporter permease subunit PstC [Candidatus Methanoperedenaceae archaeon]
MPNIRKLKESFAGKLLPASAFFSGIILFVIILTLAWRSLPILTEKSPLDLLTGSSWLPFTGEFGFYPFILSTVLVTVLALILAVPLSILSAVYLSEYATERVRSNVLPLIDLLAGIPPVVYGVFG